ncbi:hypothetical protein O0L34_g7858 [Tuta absoluta]|nr:hypothetical protein O0L34_g7858 [Tuta absoluta]
MSWQPYAPVWRQMSACSAQVEAVLCCDAPPVPRRARDRQVPDDSRPDDISNGVDVSEGGENACGPSTCCTKPGPRGGHQLVVDSSTGTLYLFGGWNGTEDLDDLWSFDTVAERWTLLCRHSQQVGGPSPRSCHKMVLDPVHRRLYTLGRYLDNARRIPANMNSDLYMYDVTSNEWSLVCADTAACGGPRLVFDHQMCIDPDSQTVFVFGGRVLPANTEEVVSPQYSGLYAYYIQWGTWQLLLDDTNTLDAPKPRVSHSMLFHPIQRRLYIFAGQRNKEHLLDLWWYDVGTGQCGALCQASAAPPPPAAGFTQRATIDPDADEMYVLSVSVGGGGGQCGALCQASAAPPPPAAGFTQRATIDPDADEMYVLSVSVGGGGGGGQCGALCQASAAPPPPAAGFTQRATIDPDADEMYVLSCGGGGGQCGALCQASAAPPPPAAGFTQRATIDPDADEMYVLSVSVGGGGGGAVRRAVPGVRRAAAARRRLHAARHHRPRRRRDVRALGECGGGGGQCGALCQASAAPPPPAAGFTQRATIDPDADEMYVLSGMSKEKDKRVYNTLWVFSLKRLTWSCVYRNDTVCETEPRPRFAHQLVLDPVTKIHYLFGGNPGNQGSPRLRLDDLWALQLVRPTVDCVLHSAVAAMREACFRELCAAGKQVTAVEYLRNDVSTALDHSDPIQVSGITATDNSHSTTDCVLHSAVAAMKEACFRELCAAGKQVTAVEYLRNDVSTALDHSDPIQLSRFKKLATVLFSAEGAQCSQGVPHALSPRRTRALARRRAQHTAHKDLQHALHAVLGADDTVFEPTQPFEDMSAPAPDTWDVGDDSDDAAPSDAWRTRALRAELYDKLCHYFRPSQVPPLADIGDLVHL